MNRMKQVLIFGKIAAFVTLLVPLAAGAIVEKKDSIVTPARAKRLVLSPKTHLQLFTESIWGDSVEAVVTVAAPDSCKSQRHLCWFETNAPVRFVTVPRYKWALRRDSLMVLSFIPLQIRLARQSFISATQPLSVKIHYQNLDHTAKLAGTTTLELLPDEKLASMIPMPTDSASASTLSADSSLVSQLSSSTVSLSPFDSTATATGSSSFGIFYVALAILLIFLFGGLSWLMTWSQRRRFQKIEARTAAMAFSHLQPQPSAPAAAAYENHAANAAITPKSDFNEAQRDLPVKVSTAADLPAVVSDENHFGLTAISSQLHELNLSLHRVLANQQEANQRLAQITAVAALAPPKPPVRVALFDILNDDAGPNGGHDAKTNGSSPRLRIQLADNGRTDGVAVEVAASAPVSIELQKDDRNNGVSFNLGASSKLRILFANPESNGGAHDEILLH